MGRSAERERAITRQVAVDSVAQLSWEPKKVKEAVALHGRSHGRRRYNSCPCGAALHAVDGLESQGPVCVN